MCGGSSGSTQGGSNSQVTNSFITNEAEDLSDIITIHKGTTVVLDSPDKCLQLMILVNIEQQKWLKELAENTGPKNTNSDQDEALAKYLEQKRQEFYKSYGLTEKDLIQYNKNHSKEIIDFMEKNPKYKKAYEQTMKGVGGLSTVKY